MRHRWMSVSLLCGLVISCATLVMHCAPAAEAAGGDRCTDPPAGLTAWWPGEGSAVDLVGDWHGALVGDTTFAAGEVGDAFTFDGTGDYVEVADASAGVLGADPFTVAFWMRSTTTGNGVYLLGRSKPDYGEGWDIRLHLGQIMVVGVNGWAVNITSAAVIEADTWHHITVASDGATVTLYIDGTTDPGWTVPRQSITPTLNKLRLAWADNFVGSYFSGQLDEIQFFERGLSATEVVALAAAAPGGSCRPCAALPEGAVAWWRAEDTFDDAVGRFNGTPLGGVPFDDGRVGRSFVFDGISDVVQLPDDDAWDFGTGSFSFSAWFDSEVGGYRNILRYHDGTGGTGIWGLRFEPNGKLEFLVRDQDASTMITLTSASVYADGLWHHVTAVRDAEAGVLRLYVDGAEAATPVSDQGVDVVAAAGTVPGIGAGVAFTGGWGYEHFAGLIDEVAIFDRALTAEEAAAMFTAGERGVCHDCARRSAGLVSWWRGDGNAFDSAGGNDGTLQNGAAFAAGLVGQAISLPTGNDFVEVPHDASLSFGATDPMSIALWAYRATDDSAQHLFSKRYDCYSTPWNYQLAWESGYDRMCFGSLSGYVCTTADKLPLAEWTHLAVTFDGSLGTFYVNGRREATATMTLGPDTNNPPLRFGSVADCDQLDQGFRGLLDEIELFGRALTIDEVRAISSAGSFGRCTDCAPVPDGIAAWWRAEGDATDAAEGNDGTEMNGASYGPGRVGRAFDFDDDAAPDYVEVQDSDSLDITGALSVEGWVQVDEPTVATVVVKGDYFGTSDVTSYGLEIGGSSADGKIASVLYGSGVSYREVSDDAVAAGRWHHLAMTWDGSTTVADNHRLYIDGQLAQTWSKASGLNSTTESLTIGAMKPPAYYRKTDGRVDELSIYSAELTAAEIRAIVAAGSAGKCVVGDSEPDAFNFVDSTGHGTGTIVGTDPITVAGIDRPAAIGISACTAPFCWYAVNDGGWTTQAGMVVDGDTVYARQMTAATQGTPTDLTLSIGGVSDTFSATTAGTWTVSVTLAGVGSGAVTSSPAGIDCGEDCSELFDAGSTVVLTATPEVGSAFSGWSGDADCADGEVTVTGDIQCTATFVVEEIFSDGFESGNTLEWTLTATGIDI